MKSEPPILPPFFDEMRVGFGASLRLARVDELVKERVLFVEDGNHGEYRPLQHEFGAVGVPFVRPPDLVNGRIDLNACERINEEARRRVRKGIGRGGDVVLSHRATVGRLALTSVDDPEFVTNPGTTIWRTLDGSEVDRFYLFYFMHTPAFQEQLLAEAGNTSTFPYVSLTQQRRLWLALPPLASQRSIGRVLALLDDKTAQNRRTSRVLDRLARAIFRAWFVDFEPVKAKAAGATSFPSMPQPVFDALPTTFADSELGPVPEGWEVKPISEAFEVNPTRQLRRGDIAPYLDMKNMPTEGHAPESWIDRPFGAGMRFMNGDTLVARITPCLENGKTSFVDFLRDGQIAWGSTEYIVLRPRLPLPPIFAYCLARTAEFRDYAIQNMSGTSGRQRVPPTAMDHYNVAVPTEKVAIAFGEIAKPMFDCVRAGMDESRKLAELRDYLLPKLLSGAVRVRDAGRVAGEVA